MSLTKLIGVVVPPISKRNAFVFLVIPLLDVDNLATLNTASSFPSKLLLLLRILFRLAGEELA